jgi:hypothetical protein
MHPQTNPHPSGRIFETDRSEVFLHADAHGRAGMHVLLQLDGKPFINRASPHRPDVFA